MRSIAVVAIAAAVGQAFSQVSASERSIQDAFAQLRGEPKIMLEMTGSDSIGPRVTNLYSTAHFAWDPANPDDSAKAEINDWVNNKRIRRITGDGLTLWAYDFGQNVYSSFRYGSYSGPQPKGYRTNLFQELTASSQGPSVYLSRMLREIYSGDFALYRTWLPMATVTVISSDSQPSTMTDPVNTNRTYEGDDLNMYVVYTYNARPQRSGAFHFSRADKLKAWTLSNIYYSDSQAVNASTPRFVDWRIAIYTGTLPSSTNFVFVPPTTARAIANVKGGG